jgi:ATP/ADP translocase
MMRPELSLRTLRVLGKSISTAFLVPFKEVPRVLFHGLILSFIICGFWLLDSLKDPVLAATVGIEYQPIAKFFSVCTTLIVVCLYDYLTSVVSKPFLFHLISCGFGVGMMVMAALLGDSETGLSKRHKDPNHYLG